MQTDKMLGKHLIHLRYLLVKTFSKIVINIEWNSIPPIEQVKITYKDHLLAVSFQLFPAIQSSGVINN